MTRTKAVLVHFRECAFRPFAAIYPRNSCITQTRIVLDILSRMQIPAEPITTSLMVIAPHAKFVYIAGFTDEEREELKQQSAGWHDVPHDGPSWRGHLITYANGYLIDTSLDQASSANRNFRIPPDILVAKLDPGKVNGLRLYGKDLNLGVSTREGHMIDIRYVPRERSGFEDSEAWQMQPHMQEISDMVVDDLKQTLGE